MATPSSSKFSEPSSTNVIFQGYGEYYVHQGENPVSEETFQKIYPILSGFYTDIFNAESPQGFYENRYQFLRERIKAIDGNLEISFIPKVLYELIYLHKSLKEDIKQNKICTHENPFVQTSTDSIAPESKCWHQLHFSDKKISEREELVLSKLAFRMNQAIFKRLKGQAHTFENLKNIAEKEIAALTAYYDNPQKLSSKTETLTRALGDKNRLAFSSQAEKDIVLQALAFECSSTAQSHLLLYRGTSWQNDSIIHMATKKCVTLSYSPSLFTGCLKDPQGTAFHFMKLQRAYVIFIPLSEIEEAGFYIPPMEITLKQILNLGELFYAKTLSWKENRKTETPGILQSEWSKEELVSKFEQTMKTAHPITKTKTFVEKYIP
jgi:hypothetical protein